MSTSKIMLLGEIEVGKTSLVHRLVDQKFSGDYKATMHVDIFPYTYRADGMEKAFGIWDIDGDLSESTLGHTYMTGASGALIIGDTTRPGTWETMVRIAETFQSRIPGAPYEYILNKCDLTRPEPSETATIFGKSTYRLTSAKSGEAVDDAFGALAGTIAKRGL